MNALAPALHAFDSHTPMREFDGVPFPNRKNESLEPTSRQNNGDGGMDFALGKIVGFNRGEQPANDQCSTQDAVVFLEDFCRDKSAKEIATKAGVGPRAAEGIKQGRNGMTMAHIVSMCRADDVFRAKFFEFCGGKLEGSPESYAALNAAIRAAMAAGSVE